MKTIKFLALAAAALTLAASCNKGESAADLAVTTDKAAITVKTSKADTLSYTATGFSGTVSVVLDSTVTDVTVNNTFDTGSGKGTAVFTTTCQKKKEYASVSLTFKDSRMADTKTISIKIKDAWSVDPEDPEEGSEEGSK